MESSAPFDCEVRAVIKFLNAYGVTGSENHRRLSNVRGAGNVVSLSHVYKWIECSNTGWSDIYDKQQTGHLRDSISDETITCDAHSIRGRSLVHNFRHSPRDGRALYIMQTCCTTIFHILAKELETKKVSAR